MPAQTSTKQIGSHTFTFAPLPAWDNFRGFFAFAKMLGPAAPHVFKAFQVALANGGPAKKTREDWMPVAVGLLGTLPQVLVTSPYEEVEAAAKLLFKNVIVVAATGKTAPLIEVVDSLLQGELMTFLELFAWCVQEAYGGFFAEAMTRLGVKTPLAPSPKAEPLPSTSPKA